MHYWKSGNLCEYLNWHSLRLYLGNRTMRFKARFNTKSSPYCNLPSAMFCPNAESSIGLGRSGVQIAESD
jgi:hypothetical protein